MFLNIVSEAFNAQKEHVKIEQQNVKIEMHRNHFLSHVPAIKTIFFTVMQHAINSIISFIQIGITIPAS